MRSAIPGQMEGSADVERFKQHCRAAGESVLAWVEGMLPGAPGGPAVHGTAILTDRRLCFYAQDDGQSPSASISMTRDELRYEPPSGAEHRVTFRTEPADLAFIIPDPTEQAQFPIFLGNVSELRLAQRHLFEAGLDGTFISPPREDATEGLSAAYQLMRLKELMNKGMLSEGECDLERMRMIKRFESEAQAPGEEAKPAKESGSGTLSRLWRSMTGKA